MVYYIVYKPPFDRMPANQNLDGDPLKVKLRDEAAEPLLRLAKGMNALQAGLAINNELLPTVIQITSGKRAVTDFDGYNGLIYVSLAMKIIIEQFDPDVHQFFSVRLVNSKKEFLASHWLWVVCNRIDSVDREHTTLVLDRGLWGAEGVENPRLVFSSSKISDHHFWRDPYLLPHCLLWRCQAEAQHSVPVA